MAESPLTEKEVQEYILDIPDEVLANMTFSMPWQYDTGEGTYKDPDGFTSMSDKKDVDNLSRRVLQTETWNKFHKNPQVNTTVRGQVGRITGRGFETVSHESVIDDVIREMTFDQRNRLYNYTPKWLGRSIIEGELFLCLTCHVDGFIEVDFIDPATIEGGSNYGTGDADGIYYHPVKSSMPLFYNVRLPSPISKFMDTTQIPSIFIARYPEMLKLIKDIPGLQVNKQMANKNKKQKFKQFGGFFRFIVAWDKGFTTRRTCSHLRTIIQWVNHYENLKKYEIDHKKSSGAYLWIIKITEPKYFKLWLTMSDTDREKTGIMAKKTPGSTIVLPPGMEMTAQNPNLPKISDQDTDLLAMVASGLNEPDDVMMNRSKGTFASVKASRGPMSDRTSDEIAYFERFWLYDFWSAIFFLRSSLTNFPKTFKVQKAIGFNDKKEPIFKSVSRAPEFLTKIIFPTSESIDYESRAKGMLGTKHGPLSETLGVPMSTISDRMGFGAYEIQRLRKAEEDELYPELIYTLDAESIQEKTEGEPKKEDND